MYPQKDQVIAIIHIPNMSRSEIIENIYEWIETKRLFGSIEILREDDDHIHLKSPVRFIGTSLAARWTPEPMMTYFITFTYKDQEIKVARAGGLNNWVLLVVFGLSLSLVFDL